MWTPKVRQLKISEVLDEGFKIFRHALGRFVLFQLILYLPSTFALAWLLNALGDVLIAMFEGGKQPDLQALAVQGGGVVLLLCCMQVFLGSLTMLAMSRGVEETYLGRTWSAKTILKETLRLAPRGVIVAAILLCLFLACVLVPALFAGGLVFVLISSVGKGIGAVVIMLLFMGAAALLMLWMAIFVVLRYGLALNVVAIEGGSVLNAFSRSVELMRGQYVRGMALMMLMVAISLIFSGPLGALVPMPDFTTLDAEKLLAMVPQIIRAQILSTILGQFISMFFQAFSSICWTLFYFSARCEKEGFDLDFLAGNE